MFRKASGILWLVAFVVLIGAGYYGYYQYSRTRDYDQLRTMLSYGHSYSGGDMERLDASASSYDEHQLVGQIWVLQGNFRKALPHFRAAAALEGPEAADAKVALGRTLLLAGDTLGAMRLADSLRKAFGPTHSPSIYLRAHVHLAQRECLKAANLFYAAFNTDSSYKRALFYRAVAYVDTNDAPHAYHNIQHYMRLEKRNPDAYLLRAIVNEMRGENGRVIDNLETMQLITDSVVASRRPWGSDAWDIQYLANLNVRQLHRAFLAEAARQDSLQRIQKAGYIARMGLAYGYIPPADSGRARIYYFAGHGMLVENDSNAVDYLRQANELDARIPLSFDAYLQSLAKFRTSAEACEQFRIRMEDKTLRWNRTIRVSTLRSLRACDNLPGWLKQQVDLSAADDMPGEALIVL